jgi:hypothetical protein
MRSYCCFSSVIDWVPPSISRSADLRFAQFPLRWKRSPCWGVDRSPRDQSPPCRCGMNVSGRYSRLTFHADRPTPIRPPASPLRRAPWSRHNDNSRFKLLHLLSRGSTRDRADMEEMAISLKD